MTNSTQKQIAFRLRAIRTELKMNQQGFSKTFGIPVFQLVRFEEASEMPSPVMLAYLSVISSYPALALDAVRENKIFALTPEEKLAFEVELREWFYNKIEHEGGRDPNDKLLRVSARDGRLKEDSYRVRYPPKTAVNPCLVNCLHCIQAIDIAYQWLEGQPACDTGFFDIDCPYCRNLNTFNSKTIVEKLLRFRKKCENWINPVVKDGGRVSSALRFKVLQRDSFKCVYCGASPQNTSLHVDHKVPVNAGGSNDIENLVAACSDCNLGKGSHSFELDE
jgi:phage FluMu protein Com